MDFALEGLDDFGGEQCLELLHVGVILA